MCSALSRNKADGKPRSLSTLSCKVNAMAAVFHRASHDRHPLTDEPLFSRPNPFRSKMTLLREVFGNRELISRTSPHEVRPYTRDELNRLLAVTRNRSRADHLILLLCARCGLRRSEAIALRWEDFNEPARSVSIRRKASKPRNVAVRVSSQLKTENSRRTLPVPSDAWQEVLLWQDHCTTQAIRGTTPYTRYTQPSRRTAASATFALSISTAPPWEHESAGVGSRCLGATPEVWISHGRASSLPGAATSPTTSATPTRATYSCAAPNSARSQSFSATP